MRITNNMTTRNYLKGLNSNASRLDSFSRQIYSTRRFNNMSEDVASGVRALQTRRELYRNEARMDLAKDTKGMLDTANGVMNQMSSLCIDVLGKYTNGINGTNQDGASDDKGIFATELEQLRNELVTLGNTAYGGKYLFGGTNLTSAPFSIDDSGKVLYNGIDISTIVDGDACLQEANYIDLGVGLSYDTSSHEQIPNSNSAFKNTIVGLDVLGYGDDSLFGVINEMIDTLREEPFDASNANDLITKFQDAQSNSLSMALTKIGTDQQYIDFTIDRLDSESVTLKDRIDTIEAVDSAEAITSWKMQEYIYNATLQMGQRLLQPTLFSFIN